MAKEFKDWELKFSRQDLDAEQASWGKLGLYYRWDFVVLHWSHEEVRKAVYEADDAGEWQRFRIALKGLTTALKLGALHKRMERCIDEELASRVYNKNEHVRIDNYIGALRRGGQLNAEYRVVK